MEHADLFVEVTSLDRLAHDRNGKSAEYELEGIREYWVMDPELHRAEFFVLRADGRSERCYEDAERYPLQRGAKLPAHWLWEHPPLREAIRCLE